MSKRHDASVRMSSRSKPNHSRCIVPSLYGIHDKRGIGIHHKPRMGHGYSAPVLLHQSLGSHLHEKLWGRWLLWRWNLDIEVVCSNVCSCVYVTAIGPDPSWLQWETSVGVREEHEARAAGYVNSNTKPSSKDPAEVPHVELNLVTLARDHWDWGLAV